MEFTGERFTPEFRGDIELEHIHRYNFASLFSKNKIILDIASGEGYGSFMLAEYAKKVIGIDISTESIKHASEKYKKENLEFLVGDCSIIPLPNDSIDLIVSFETIEHHDKHLQMLLEFKRVLRRGGIVIISSPDKLNYSIKKDFINEFHVKELFEEEFKNLLSDHFEYQSFFGQKVTKGSLIAPEGKSSSFISINKLIEFKNLNESYGIKDPIYWIGVCSNSPLINDTFSSIYENNETYVDNRDTQIKLLDEKLTERDAHINLLDERLAQRDAHINLLDERLTQLQAHILSTDKKYQDSLIEIQNLKFENNSFRHKASEYETFLFFQFIKKLSSLKSKLSRTIIGSLYRNAKSILSFQKKINENKEEVQISVLRNKINGKKLIIVFPIITWSFRWQRPQQFISRMRDRGYTIIYIAMTLSPIQRLFKTNSDSLQSLRIQVLEKDIFKVWLSSFNPLNIYSDQIDGLNFKNLSKQLNSIVEEVSPKDIYFLVHFPSWFPLVSDLKNNFGGKVIFDCMDDHSGFSNTTKAALNEESNLLKKSDLVVVSSDVLEKKCLGLNKNIIHIKNGCEFNHFNQSKKNGFLNYLASKPIIGYYGAIADWFDSDLVLNAAQSYSDWNFVLIGDTHGADTESLMELDNVHFLGEIPYRELPGYFAYFDVCLIPFKIIPLTLATNPVKFYEYLSDGKPVVSTNLPELKTYEKDCYLTQDKNDFIAKIRKAYDDRKDIRLIERRLKIAKDNSWDSRVNELLNNEIFN